MFDLSFLGMIGTYNERRVANDKCDLFEVDTAIVTDRPYMYETAIKHRDFNNNDWIIIGWANDKKTALDYHRMMVECALANDYETITDIFTWQVFKRKESENVNLCNSKEMLKYDK